jgi:hypothetical protein
MAVSQSQIVDLLYKQAFGVTKTDTATNKSPSNESIASPLLIRGDTQWTQSNAIPGTAATTAGIVQAYLGVDAIECTADNTTVPIGGIYPSWETGLTYWIPSEFGSTYNIQIWVDSPGVANPTSTGTQIFADGAGGTGQWYYNYQSGVLNFIGETIPASLTAGKVIYVVGYRYIGLVGVTNLPSGTVVSNLSFNGSNISSTGANANINLTPNGSGIVVSSANIYATTFVGNVVGNVSGNITIGGANTQLIFNDDGLANGNANLTFNKANSLLTLSGILSVSGNTSIGGNLNMSSQWINNVGYPSLSTDAASKAYVDTMVSTGIAYHSPVNVATTTTLAVATGGTTAYNSPNGAANGIGAYISTTGTFLLIDSANVQTVGSRILVKNEANATWNGIYTYANTTAIIRAIDADEYGPDSTTQLSINDYFFTLGGVVNEGTAFVVSAPAGEITFGTSNITFSTFSVAQIYEAGDGLTLTGTTFSVNTAQPNITSVGTLTALSIVGGANIGNIGTAGIITATGNITGGNIVTAGLVSATGNGIFGNINTAGLLTVTGNITGSNIVTGGIVSATGNGTFSNISTGGLLTVTGNANIGNIGTGGLINATGNITGGNLITGGVVTATGNVTGANLTTIGLANIGNLEISGTTTGNLIPSANVTFNLGNATNRWKDLFLSGSTILIGDQNISSNAGGISLSNSTFLADVFVSGNANVNLNIQGNTANFIGNVIAPNVTVNLEISGNTANFSGNVIAANLRSNALTSTRVTFAGTSGILTDSGNLTYNDTTQLLAVLGNSQFNNANLGNLATANFVNVASNTITNNLTVNLELIGNTANFSGNVVVPNLSVNLALTGNTANFSGNITTLNANLGNLATANFVNVASNTITSNLTVNLELTGNTANFSGNVIVPNLSVNLALAGNTANFSGNITTLNANLGNLATANYFTGTFSNGTSNISIPTTNGNINLAAGGVTSLVVTNTGANVTGNLGVSGNFSVGSLISNNLSANLNVFIGNTTITWSTLTTTAITANQTISSVSVTGVTGVEFLVKGIDSSGGKYSVATVQAVTDGANVDYTTFGTVLLGGYTGSLAVNIVGSNINLQVTPASSNSTVWTTQYRII